MQKLILGLLFIIAGIMGIALSVSAGLGAPVFLVFLVLKLCNVITFNWFLVFLPLIVGVVALVLLGVLRGLKQIGE